MLHAREHNLRVGAWAFQLDLLSKETLIEALGSCGSQVDKKLEDMLLETEQIDPATHQVLRTLSTRQIAASDRNIGWQPRSADELAQFHAEAQHRSGVPDQAIVDASLFATLEPSPLEPSPPERLETAKIDPKRSQERTGREPPAGRYSIVRPHAKGGLGEVSLAIDTELNRQVALKQIQSRYADDPQAQQRFLLEAEVTGGLEHPGVVPVYGLGRDADGRPYYAMRFIRGESLHQASLTFHREFGQAPPSSRQTLALRNLIDRFVNVCQTIAYAHSRNVLHRDLKPDNIMLGPYGETLVVDWGLAKASGEEVQSIGLTESVLKPISGSGSAPTRMGAVIGTPAYMSPEQATGRIDKLGPASDVYSLGATLYFVICGVAPFGSLSRAKQDKLDVEQVLRQVKHGDFPKPREVRASVPKPLAAICLKAMARQAEDRYASPMTLAEDLQRFLADEPVSAYAEPLMSRVRRWGRQHQTLATTATALLLTTIVGLSIFSSMLKAKQTQLEDTNRNLVVAEKQAASAAEQAELGRQEAERQRVEAEGARLVATQAQGDQAAFSNFLTYNLLATARPVGIAGGLGINVTVVDALEAAEPQIADVFAGSPNAEATARAGIGSTWSALGNYPRAIAQLEIATKLLREEVGEDHLDFINCQANLASALKGNGQLKQAIAIQENLLEKVTKLLGDQSRERRTLINNLAVSYNEAGEIDKAISMLENLLELQVKTLGKDNPETLNTLDNLAGALFVHPDVNTQQRSLAIYEDIVPRKRRILGEFHPQTLSALNNLATYYQKFGENAKAIQMLEQTDDSMRRQLGADHPQTLTIEANLAMGYLQEQQFDKAIDLLQDVIQRSTRQLSALHPDTLNAVDILASVYSEMGDTERSIPTYEQAWEGRVAVLGATHPDTLTTQNNLALEYNLVGELDKALPLFQEVLAERRRTLPEDDDRVRISINNLAILHTAMGQPALALPLHQELVNRWAGAADDMEQLRLYSNLAGCYTALADYTNSAATWQLAINKLSDTPVASSWQFAQSRLSLARSLMQIDKGVEAEAILTELVEELRSELQTTSTDENRSNLRSYLLYLATCQNLIGKFNEAEVSARESLTIASELIPGDWRESNTRSILGESLLGQNRQSEAQQLLTQAHKELVSQFAKIPYQLHQEVIGGSFDRSIRLFESLSDESQVAALREQKQQLLEPKDGEGV